MALMLALVALVIAQVGVPAMHPGEWVVDSNESGMLSGQVVDPVAGRPVAGVPVRLSRHRQGQDRTWPEPWVAEHAGAANEQLGSVATDAEGRFTFRGLRPGRYRVRAAGALRATATAEAWITPEHRTRTVEIEVEVGAQVGGIVLDHEGQPLGDFPVRLVGFDRGDGLNSLPRDVRVGQRTAPDGHFLLSQLPTGTVYLQAGSSPRGYSVPVALEVRSGETVDQVTLVVPDEQDLLTPSGEGVGGIGVRLEFTPRGPVIDTLIEGMAAHQAGLLAGDRLEALAGRSTRFMLPREFIERCLGLPGSVVTVRIVRGDESFDVELTRRMFPSGQR
jgi:hypothetical protein